MTKLCFSDGVHDISNEEYHSSEGISRSALMKLELSPYHYWYEYISGYADKEKDTESMKIGNAFHTLLLEPHLFNDDFIVMPPIDRRTKEGKAAYADFEASAGMKTILTEYQYDTAKSMADAVLEHKMVKDLIYDAQYEQSIYWTDEETGLQFKARPDIWHPHIVVDLKSTKSGEYRDFQSSAIRYGYFLQAGMMYEACRSISKPFEKFVFLSVEKTKPYAPSVYPLDDWAIEFGIEQFNSLKKTLRMCIDKNEWPSYPIKELRIPTWARDTIDYMADFDE